MFPVEEDTTEWTMILRQMQKWILDLDVKAPMTEKLPGVFILKGILNSIFSFISVVLVDSHGLLSLNIREDSYVKTGSLYLLLYLQKGPLQ